MTSVGKVIFPLSYSLPCLAAGLSVYCLMQASEAAKHLFADCCCLGHHLYHAKALLLSADTHLLRKAALWACSECSCSARQRLYTILTILLSPYLLISICIPSTPLNADLPGCWQSLYRLTLRNTSAVSFSLPPGTSSHWVQPPCLLWLILALNKAFPLKL